MSIAEYATILVERRDPVVFLRLNRQERLNTINRQMKDDLLAVLDALRTDRESRVLIIAGAGPKAFCAGADVNEFTASGPVDRWRYDWDYPRRIFEEIEHYPKPVIAMIHGYCLGGGAEIALACDLRVASDDAELGLTEIRFGMIPGAGGTQRLVRFVGEGMAMRLVLTGDRISATVARQIGLVEEVVPRERLEAETLALAERITHHSPIAVQVAKHAVRSASRMPLESGLLYEVALSTLCFATEDKEEAVRAFLERREPHYRGR
jgi:enoyl-CoA hydratase/carnithine racemase